MGTKKQTKTFTTAELREFAKGLRLVANRIEAGIEVLSGESVLEVEIANWKSGDLGIKNFLAFARSFNDTVDATLLKTSAKADVAEAETSIEENRRKHRTKKGE